MALVSISTPSLIQGVSQQPALMRFPAQGEIQENAYPSVLDGLQKRHPTEHITLANIGGSGEPLVHFINRDPTERYAVVFYPSCTTETPANSTLRIWDLVNGVEVPVWSDAGEGVAADFSYIALPAAADVATFTDRDFRTLAGWTAVNNIAPSAVTSNPPWGVRFNGAQPALKTFKIGNSGASGATYTQTASGGAIPAEGIAFSLYFRRNDYAGQSPLSSITLTVRDTTASVDYSATFEISTSGDYTCSPLGIPGSTPTVDTLPDGWFRGTIYYQPSAATVGNAYTVKVSLPSGVAGDSILVWGARVDTGNIASDPLYNASTYLKALTVADYTFILNTTKATAMQAATYTPTDPNLTQGFASVVAGNYRTKYELTMARSGGAGDVAVSVKTWDGTASTSLDSYVLTVTNAGTATTGTWDIKVFGHQCIVPPATHGFTNDGTPTAVEVATGLKAVIGQAFTNLGTAQTNLFSVITNITGGTPTAVLNLTAKFAGQVMGTVVTNSGGTAAFTLAHNTDTEYTSIKTDDIAQYLMDQINGLGDGWAATRVGSVIQITNGNGAITKLQAHDSRGDTNLVAVWNKIDAFDRLPLTCAHDYVITVTGDPIAVEDDYYVKFVAEAGSGFGAGNWIETARPSSYAGVGDSTLTTLDASTMPHQLVRMQGGGGKYFAYGNVAWNTRQIGDTTTAPQPSFAGSALDDIFFWKNRLGFLSGQKLALSEASVFFNFFRTTVRTLLDGDPIDLAVNSTAAVHLRHAVPFDDTLFLFGDQEQFKVTSEPILSPKQVQVTPTLTFKLQKETRPIAAARGVFFASPRDTYTSLQQIVGAPNTNRVDTLDVCGAVPRYIPGTVRWLASSDPESCIVLPASLDRQSLYVYKYHDSGQERLQSAWHRYTFGSRARLMGGFFIDSTLYLAVQRDAGLYLEKMTISPGSVDAGLDFKVYLDRRIAVGTATSHPGVFAGGETTWDLPYSVDPGTALVAVAASNGQLLTPGTTGTVSKVAVVGNHTTETVYVGTLYTKRYRFTRPVLRETSGAGKSPVVGGRLQVLRGRIAYAASQYFKVTTTPELRTPEYSVLDLAATDTGIFSFGVGGNADGVTIEVTNDTHRPSNLTNVEWECNYVNKTTRAPS